jgi:protein gp37
MAVSDSKSTAWSLERHTAVKHKILQYFFKQWGGVNKKATGLMLEDRTWDAYPRARFHST